MEIPQKEFTMIWKKYILAASISTLGLLLQAPPSLSQTVANVSGGQQMITQDETIRPFHVNFSDEALADLRRRVLATHWPDQETVGNTSQGVQLATMQKLAQY
jgi:hypothetical protein